MSEALEKAIKFNLKDEKLFPECENILRKKIAERELIDQIKKATLEGHLDSSHGTLKEDIAIYPLEQLLAKAQDLSPFYSNVSQKF